MHINKKTFLILKCKLLPVVALACIFYGRMKMVAEKLNYCSVHPRPVFLKIEKAL